MALFILFYIVLVGPLDYFILKKLFKRLEFTWITFPVSVIVVSVVVYFAAYGLKGEDLRINKIDLVEVDLVDSKQVYGSTWFSLFSPRVAGLHGRHRAGEPTPGPRRRPPRRHRGRSSRSLEAGDTTTLGRRSQALFRRPYEYADEEAAACSRVPVPVWSTRSFKASWRAPLRAKTPAVGITDEAGPIRKARGGSGLAGRITNNLAVEAHRRRRCSTRASGTASARWSRASEAGRAALRGRRPGAEPRHRRLVQRPDARAGAAAGPVGPAHRRRLQGQLPRSRTRRSSR